jgi:hypothetical protein
MVESGSRHLLETLLPIVYANHPELTRLDLVTCYPTPPAAFDGGRGEALKVSDHQGREGRRRLYQQLRERGYDILGIVCSGEPLMTKWKWALAARVPAKLFILNENGDYFFFDRSNWRIIVHFALFRAGLTGAEGASTIARVLVFPFTLLYLAAFAAWVHARRALRS